MNIVRDKITHDELKKMSEKMPDKFIKAVVDIENNIMVVDMLMHFDGESLLMQEGCGQENLWGINLYPYRPMQDWIEFYSHINVKPVSGNTSRWVEDAKVQEKIKKIINGLVIQ